MASHNNASLPVAPVTPPRPGGRHQITRSISEVTSPSRLSRAAQQHSHSRQSSRHHHHHHLQPHRKDKGHDDSKVPQSAHPIVSRSSLDIPHYDGASRSRHHLPRPDELVKDASNTADTSGIEEEKLRKEHEKASARVEGLRKSLVELHSFSTTATRRLDETYYAVLEKMSALQNTVTALKDLAETSRDLYRNFEKESGDLESEISGQIDTLGPFDEQEEKIESLQSRIRDGRAKIQDLSSRVDVVRMRVESWDRADKAWQERTRRRLRVIWSILFVVLLAVGVLFLGASGPTPPGSSVLDEEPLLQELEVKPDTPLGRLLNDSRRTAPLTESEDGKADESVFPTKPMEADERLRAFDEL